jgi:hypothetical protein
MMQMMAFMLIVAMLSGCLGYKPFQPNPHESERWSKPGQDEFGVRKTMLECGYPSPNGVRDRMVSLNATPDEIVLMYKCMSNSGFLYDGRKCDVCKSYADVMSCQPNVVVPKPEASRRLDSKFCHVYPRADVCKP